ncbi:MAG: hypothetical protein KAS32_27160, partial [Candidatus Peribacteraceae bacterium]|nr:hypothetical protein [Candidatus Peribacteraceae bacterium]
DNDTVNCTLLDGTTIFNNLIDPDSDNDGVLDGYEWAHNSDMLVVDTEGDGLSDFQELKIYYTNPCDWDTDWDGLSDYEEVYLALDNIKTNPINNDTDNDNLLDGWADLSHDMIFDANEEWGEIGDPAQPIALENRNEGGYGTNATRPDTDYDGLNDGDEFTLLWEPVWDITKTSDSNNDLIDTGWNSDSDDDGLINLLDPDSDNDGINDGPEKVMWESYDNIMWPGWNQNSDELYTTDRKINIIDYDSDQEGLNDGEEMLIYRTRADKTDTDEDGEWYFYINGAKRWPKAPFSNNMYGMTAPNNVFNDFSEINYWKFSSHNFNNTMAGFYATQLDSDSDGLMDGWEAHYGLNPNDNGIIGETAPGFLDGPNGSLGDPDHDGLTNIQEYKDIDLGQYNLFPTYNDTDSDGLYDGFNDANGDGIWNDYGVDGMPDTFDYGEGDSLWQNGEEAWGEVGDVDTPTSYGYAGGYGLLADDTDSDNDAFGGVFYDGYEVQYWQSRVRPAGDRTYTSEEAGINAMDYDVDNDLARDGWEAYWNINAPSGEVLSPDDPNDGGDDPDSDGMTNSEEEDGWLVKCAGYSAIRVYSSPWNSNIDGDALNDKAEKNYGIDSGWAPEPAYGTNPNMADTDGDGLNDGISNGEGTWSCNALDRDTDNDRLWDGDETSTSINKDPYSATWTSTPTLKDSDEDGLWDGDEQQLVEMDGYSNTYKTSPTDHDYDDDELWDGDELNLLIDKDPYESLITSDSTLYDTDGDGMWDGDEQQLTNKDTYLNLYLTDPNESDTDGDGISDSEEVTDNNLVAWVYGFENTEVSSSPLKAWDALNGIWQRSNSKANLGSYSYACGHSATNAESHLISETIHIPDTEDITIHYWSWMDMYPGDFASMGIRTAANEYLGQSYVRGTITQSQWVEQTLDVSDFKGMDVKLEFYYNGYKGTTTYQGWFVDNIWMTGGTNPTLEDTDGDGLWDGNTIIVGGVEHIGELDGTVATKQLTDDTDFDFLSDGDELLIHGTDPKDANSDNDVLYDYEEVLLDTDPNLDSEEIELFYRKVTVYPDHFDTEVIKLTEEERSLTDDGDVSRIDSKPGKLLYPATGSPAFVNVIYSPKLEFHILSGTITEAKIKSSFSTFTWSTTSITKGASTVDALGRSVMKCSIYLPSSASTDLYDFSVTVDGVIYTAEHSVQTMISVKSPFTFIQLTDIHIGDGANPFGGDNVHIGNFLAIKNRINKLEKPDFVIITGDLADSGTAAETEYFKACLLKFEMPVFLTPGNH